MQPTMRSRRRAENATTPPAATPSASKRLLANAEAFSGAAVTAAPDEGQQSPAADGRLLLRLQCDHVRRFDQVPAPGCE